MRTSGLPNFEKLWGRIHQDLSPGNYVITINNSFNLTEWSGKKYIILSTDSSAGGKNYLLPIMLLLIGLGSFFAAFFLKRISV
jgi:hypothetical protein